MSVEIAVPSLNIYRPVSNIPSELCLEIREEACKALGIPRHKLQISRDLKAYVLMAGSLTGLFTKLGSIASAPMIDALADHLDEQLPDSFDETSSTTTFPLEIHKYKTGRKAKTLALGTINETVQNEAQRTIDILWDFYKLNDRGLEQTKEFPFRPYGTQVHFARSCNADLLEELQHFLQESQLLPGQVIFDQGTIEDVVFDATYSDDFLARL